ncbi:hypothetical protein PWT90_02297 [Aphanocladium album]|nr:hypothetical protein PWT90_02297 [Aphanocladium album]
MKILNVRAPIGKVGCHLDFISVHWHVDHSQEADFENWVNRVCDLVADNGRKVWITEFKGWCHENEQIAFFKKAIPFLDNSDCVERYSSFGINNSSKDLIKGNGPDMSNLGFWYAYKVPTEN